MIDDYVKEWFGKKVVEYDKDADLHYFDLVVYRLGYSWDNEVDVETQLDDYFTKLNSDKVEALIIGSYGEVCDDPSAIYKKIIENASKLSNLKGLFLGDMAQEDSEISWIHQGNIKPILEAFPRLEELRIRGANDLVIGDVSHSALKKLTIETGGLDGQVVRDIAKANFPELEHLELWLGTDEYGGNVTLADVTTLLNQSFPKLNSLGIKNNQLADECAPIIANAKILSQIEHLDVSLGNISDVGGKVFLESNNLGNLKTLNFTHNYFSDEMKKSLAALSCKVDTTVSGCEDEYEGERYIAVSE